MQLSIQEVDIVEDFFSLELGNLDAILGVQWMENLVLWPLIGKYKRYVLI